MNQRAPQILLVDDNPADVELTREASAGGRFHCKIHHEVDGERALAYLRRVHENGEEGRPDLVLLDLNLPGKNGRQVLLEVKRSPDFCTTPVVVFSSSECSRDVQNCYEAGANCYVRKPVNLEDFFSAIWAIEEFWFGSARLPEEGQDGCRGECAFD